ncbi:hypothetical protein [Antiquaquibacter soli]|uniref:DUF2336 domain-containing protein n=1 Tax=Antiquaquibacter soli TaxID=3064523 RepID=A0ABT9BLB9_9MICO|nr:hypothetical protein [Protaetiibacter sp. WY-16]MDO7881805.1 hypothetical protein [Protaetiibacter sp. WY-16]
MSCIRFNTPAQRAQLRALAPAMLTAEQAAALHPAPAMTESKIARLRLLARDETSKIRERAALDPHLPTEDFELLARDADAEVRACVARNEATPCDVLRSLVDDPSERVRGFLAVNFFVPADAMERLANDPSPIVRDLVRWKAELATA